MEVRVLKDDEDIENENSKFIGSGLGPVTVMRHVIWTQLDWPRTWPWHLL